MPKKSRVKAHGTQAGLQSNTELYKSISAYKTLVEIPDETNSYLKDVYENNIWNYRYNKL